MFALVTWKSCFLQSTLHIKPIVCDILALKEAE